MRTSQLIIIVGLVNNARFHSFVIFGLLDIFLLLSFVLPIVYALLHISYSQRRRSCSTLDHKNRTQIISFPSVFMIFTFEIHCYSCCVVHINIYLVPYIYTSPTFISEVVKIRWIFSPNELVHLSVRLGTATAVVV
jgi:hypothetical protein